MGSDTQVSHILARGRHVCPLTRILDQKQALRRSSTNAIAVFCDGHRKSRRSHLRPGKIAARLPVAVPMKRSARTRPCMGRPASPHTHAGVMRATSIQALLALSREVQRRHYVGADAGERAREEVLQLELHFRRRALGALGSTLHKCCRRLITSLAHQAEIA